MHEVLLVVDDEPIILEGLKHFFQSEGFIVNTARDGADAIARHELEPAALIISDVAMPKVDGVSLIQILRRRKDQTPAILMSANRLRFDGFPGVQYISKPFDVDDLLRLVRIGLNRNLCEESPI